MQHTSDDIALGIKKGAYGQQSKQSIYKQNLKMLIQRIWHRLWIPDPVIVHSKIEAELGDDRGKKDSIDKIECSPNFQEQKCNN